ncbi:hypothetical protein CFOL_v3_11102 [Cephalotus follicularis]|uniref:MULE transposase domain-containing protein n=1 Tax=Cephalotus follicularis TaxID=3775 RepID=A0A1Q3BHV2_CEPFO|nr:hypothetical protein CFOL_v3_11102 [Cephalotus follicularis]
MTTKVLASELESYIIIHPSIRQSQLRKLCKEKFRVDVSLSMCGIAKLVVFSGLQDKYNSEYGKLCDYAEELRQTNTGTTMKMQVDRNPGCNPMFKRFYIYFNACKEGWKVGCIPILGLDGCFLKGPAKWILLSVVGKDGSNQLFPVAWAFVEVECIDSWR